MILRRAKQFIFMTVLAGFLFLFAIISNMYQPTMDYDLHCTVHDRIVSTFGGECDAKTSNLHSSIYSLFGSIIITVAAAFALYVVSIATALILQQCARRPDAVHGPPLSFLTHYFSSGIAASRRFV